MLEFEVFVADYGLAHAIPAWLFITFNLYLTKSIVDKFVHETVEQSLAAVSADSIGPLCIVKVLFFYLRKFVSYK